MLSRFPTRLTMTLPKMKNARSFLTVVKEYEKGVKLNFGKYTDTLEPGLRLNVPIYHSIYKVDLRETIMGIPKQSVISRDNVTFYVDAAVQFKAVDAEKAVLNVDNYIYNVMEKSQLELRDLLGEKEINEILQKKEEISNKCVQNLKHLKDEWGVDVRAIQIKDISFAESMERAMAVKAEADRSAEAKIINAEADIEVARKYKQASEIYQDNPVSLKLRELELWRAVSKNPANTMYVIPSTIAEKVDKLLKE